jgi:hypothetical protein
MPDWSIKIVPTTSQIAGILAEFVPNVNGAKPGDSLKVEQGDLISWNDTSNTEAHWPWLCANDTYKVQDPPPGGVYLTTDPIQPRHSSPFFNVIQPQGTILYYCCRYHPQERGRVVVVGFGDTTAQDAPSA